MLKLSVENETLWSGWWGSGWNNQQSYFRFMNVYTVFPQLNDSINENHVEIISSY